MSKGKYLLVGAILLVLALVLPAVSACAPAAAPPPKEKVVSYLSLGDYTGPIAGLNVPADTGCEDMFKEINAEGGVDGVKVNAIFVDTRYDTARGVSAYKRYRAEPKLLVVNAISTPFGKAIMPMTVKDKVVQLAPGDGEAQAFTGWVFPWGVCYQNAMGASIDYMLEDWKAKGKSGTPTLGYMSWDSAYGREPLRGGQEYAEKMGVNLLPPEFFPTGALDHSVWLTRLAEGGADYIFIGGVDPTPSNIMRDANKLGLTETIQFCDTTFWGPTEAVGVKLHPAETEGCWVNSYYLRGDECWSHPLAAKMVPKYRGMSVDEFRKNSAANYVTGMVWALVYKEGLKKALAAVGYENLDGGDMKAAYESLTGMDIGQGLVGPCTYSPTNREGSDQTRFYVIKGGKEVPLTGFRKVPDCVALHDWSKD